MRQLPTKGCPRRGVARGAAPEPSPCPLCVHAPGFSDLHAAEPRMEDIVLSGLGHELSRVTQHEASGERIPGPSGQGAGGASLCRAISCAEGGVLTTLRPARGPPGPPAPGSLGRLADVGPA
ncbi:Hypothetical predicted protein [Marmota monax]|uniref:Uncharacterized protein n=1 Tax=Marmota monax TaxID=9995 RepID=A0A5E4AAF6_MARMO|nr:hypothetical protein GHT09_000658 [Marmota monax]VTJ54287.1 Hypothetical predicted protein [Marmota monax]